MSKKIKIVTDQDGIFAWGLLSDEAKNMSNNESMYELHDDGSESLIETADELDNAIKNGNDIGIELGHIKVYDNGGETLDRYTVFTHDAVYGMSETGGGFNQYVGDPSEIEEGDHLGKKLDAIPEGILSAVTNRLLN